MSRARKIILGILGAFALFAVLCASMFVCLPALVMHGIAVNECPDGDLHQTLRAEAWQLRRGGTGIVNVTPIAHYTTGRSDAHATATVGGLSATLSLVDAAGAATPLKPEDGWDENGDTLTCAIALPVVPDGDYKLHIEGRSRLGPAEIDVPLAIYAPAAIHVLTDRPLYEPGNVVKMRALALRARDLSPLDGRPGRWTMTDANGEQVFEERAPAGEWGIAAGNFPLDRGAAIGTWTLRWESGSDSGETQFRVEPFTLPRFRAEISSERPAWFMGERPVVRGQVLYSSGAPVGSATLELAWTVDGAWPPPSAWTDPEAPADQRLPTRATADREGRFALTLPAVPGDLQGNVNLRARVTATDPTGEAIATGLNVLLAEERIGATAVTELGDGLVEGYNNRLYVRVATPWGAPLPDTKLEIRRAWDSDAKPIGALTDADGVAEIQIDPGPAVNVVIPAPPYRAPPSPPAVTRGSVTDELFGEEVTLDDLTALERWDEAVAGCAIRAPDANAVDVAALVRVGADGGVRSIWAGSGPVADCVSGALRGQRLPAGQERLLHIPWNLRPPARTWLQLSNSRAWPAEPEGLSMALADAAARLRGCLPRDPDSAEVGVLEWSAQAGSRVVSGRWTAPPDAAIDAATQSCLRGGLGTVPLTEPVEASAFGVLDLSLQVPEVPGGPARQSPTILQGYELKITASSPQAVIGTTLLRLPQGQIPDIRLRATPLMPRPGDTVTVEVLRGPGFNGTLPEELYLTSALFQGVKGKLDAKTREVQFQLPTDAKGWFEVNLDGAVARVFVADTASLSVSVEPEQARYAPGQAARLRVQTLRAGVGQSAAVGLFGVDESLGQLVALPGPDALDALRPSPTTSTPAFGLLDGAALAMGRIRGPAAAAATILRVSAVPTPAELDRAVNGNADQSFDPNETLVESFYSVLSELHRLTRAWEHDAPAGEQMVPATMARLWTDAVNAARDAKQPYADAWGRPLRLRWLPQDLLMLTDPREVVLDGTRLPEDVENWIGWVQKERP